jgi:S1-C subfamily serine protease
MNTQAKIAAALIGLIVGATGGVMAQERQHAEGDHLEACGEHEVAIGELGIKGLACGPCTQTRRDGRWIWRFDAEPAVLEIQEDGPAAGKLEAGDEIVSVNGLLITSAEGGDRWSNVEPGETVTLVVRREGRERTVGIQAGSRCQKRAFSVPHDVDVAIQMIEHGEHRAITLIKILPEGWFGFSFSCNCMARVTEEETTWEFEDAPKIVAVAKNSPAARAGLETGDLIVAADGHPVTDNEGARRLTTVRPGETVQLTIERNGREITVEITAADRPIGD